MTRERPKAVSLTERAADRVKHLLERDGKSYLRIGVKNGGCAGMAIGFFLRSVLGG